MLVLPPLSLYVHIPWCVRKCPYCDFNSHRAGDNLPEADYVQRLLADLQQSLPAVQGRRLHSVFFGGGTPSLFSPDAIAEVLSAAERYIGFEAGAEITMEANPGTFEQEKFRGFRAAGVNRLSIGVQSFSDLHLQQLGRIHSAGEAVRAVAMAREAGFDNLNIDLMHGLPGQTPADACADLQQALALQPEHLSWYQLTIEPNTEFYRRPPLLPEDDTLADIQQAGEVILAQAGLQQYEVSAFARPGRRSRHNLNYWQFGDYLGIGAGAHGKITWPQPGRIERTRMTRLPQHYLQREETGLAAAEPVDADELALEFMMNALRLCDGVERRLFGERTGLPWSQVAGVYGNLCERGLVVADEARIATTSLGQRYLNEVLSAFLGAD